jgi:hypothetical protein
VRDSVRDLAPATAVFIGYVHQVLEVSHTFSSFYLREQISYADLKLSSQLLPEATREAVDLLAVDGDQARSAAERHTPGSPNPMAKRSGRHQRRPPTNRSSDSPP